jgi:acetyl esterase/lipase
MVRTDLTSSGWPDLQGLPSPGVLDGSRSWSRREVLAALGAGVAAVVLGGCGDDGTSPPDADEPVEPLRTQLSYGDAPGQSVDLTIPGGVAERMPVVVLVHGGSWGRDRVDRSAMEPLVPSLLERGWAVANVGYRGVEDAGGGFPGTFEDVAAAMDALVGSSLDRPIDLARVATVGHSAGGHLALWLVSRHRLPADAPGAGPPFGPVGAVALAGVADLRLAATEGVLVDAVAGLLGGPPDQVPDRYAVASPAELVPIGVPVAMVHGTDDDVVPLANAQAYVAAAEAAGDPVELVVIEGSGHNDGLDPGHPAWDAALTRLERLLG